MVEKGPKSVAGHGVQAIDRAVAILQCFDGRTEELGISDLARRTALSTTTVHRLSRAMLANGLIRQADSKRYGLGPFWHRVINSGALPAAMSDVAIPIMNELRDASDETIGWHELVGRSTRVVVAQVESTQALRASYTDVGVPTPLLSEGPGMAILCGFTDQRLSEYLGLTSSALKRGSDADSRELIDEIRRARATGYVFAPTHPTGIAYIAAPVFNQRHGVVGALVLSAPLARMSSTRAAQVGPQVCRSARMLSRILGAEDQ